MTRAIVGCLALVTLSPLSPLMGSSSPSRVSCLGQPGDSIEHLRLRTDFLYLPLDQLWAAVKQTVTALRPATLKQCPELYTVLELTSLAAQAFSRGDTLPAVQQLSDGYAKANKFLSALPLSAWVEHPWGWPLASLVRRLAMLMRPHLKMREDVAYPCAIVHRHTSSTTALHRKYPGELEKVSGFLPVAPRVRDLTISGKHCTPETALTLIATARSLLQLHRSFSHTWTQKDQKSDVEDLALPEGVRRLVEEASQAVARENVFRLMGMSTPLFDVFHSFLAVTRSPRASTVPRKFLHTPGESMSMAPVFGFRCGAWEVQDRLTLLAVTGNSSQIAEEKKLPQSCEIGNLVLKLLGLLAVPPEVAAKDLSYSSSYRQEWLFLQSINSNWLGPLSRGWGLAVAATLTRLAHRFKRAHIKPVRAIPKYCSTPLNTIAAVNITRYLASQRDFSSAVESNGSLQRRQGATLLSGRERFGEFSWDEMFRQAMSHVTTVHPDCSVDLAAGMFLALDICWAYAAPLGTNRTDTAARRDILTADGGMLLEMGWQTIAGEKLLDILVNPQPLPELMESAWRRLYYRAALPPTRLDVK